MIRGLLPCLPIAVLCLGVFANAAEYQLDRSVQLRGLYDDNVRLNDDDVLSGAGITPSVDFRRDDGLRELTSAVQLGANAYNQDGYDLVTHQSNLGYLRRYERGSAQLGLTASQQSTRTTEASDLGSGLIEAAATRIERYGVSLRLNRQLSQRHSLAWSGSASVARYESDLFSDQDNLATGLTWNFALTERWGVSLSANYSQVESELMDVQPNPLFATLEDCLSVFIADSCLLDVETRNEQDVLDIQVGINYAIGERLRIDIEAGRSNVDSERETFFIGPALLLQSPSFSRDSDIYSVDLSYKLERLDFILSASSQNSVDSFGRARPSDRVSILSSWRVTEHDKLRATLSWADQGSVDDDLVQLQGRRTNSASLTYTSKFHPHWSLGGGYSFRSQETNFSGDEKTNQLTLTLEWRPTTLKWSR